MEIYRGNTAPQAEKPDGTRITYHLFPEYEVHYNEIPPGTVQVWHHHEQIEEAILITEGALEARWKDEDQREQRAILEKGDLVRTGITPHTFANTSQALVKFVAFKLVLNGVDHRNLLKTDKVIDH